MTRAFKHDKLGAAECLVWKPATKIFVGRMEKRAETARTHLAEVSQV